MGSSGPYVTDPDNENARFDTDDTENVNTSRLVTEGLALYLQEEVADLPPHKTQKYNYHRAAKKKLQTAPHDLLQSLHENPIQFRAHGITFDRKQVFGNYIIAGSFSKYLIDREGMEKFVQVYRSQDFRSVYLKNLIELQAGWLSFLEIHEGV